VRLKAEASSASDFASLSPGQGGRQRQQSIAGVLTFLLLGVDRLDVVV
jgi:hypothetical protein